MNFLQKYPFPAQLLNPFRLSQQKTAAEIIVALCEAGAANSFLIAGKISTNNEIQLQSARISLLRIGIFYWQAATKRAHLTMKFVKANLPKPKFRYFQWLVVSQN